MHCGWGRLLWLAWLRCWVQPLGRLIWRGWHLLAGSCRTRQAAGLPQHSAAQGCSAQRACCRGKHDGRPLRRLLLCSRAAIASRGWCRLFKRGPAFGSLCCAAAVLLRHCDCRASRRAKQLLRRGPHVRVVLCILPLPPPRSFLRWADQISQCWRGHPCCRRQARCTNRCRPCGGRS